MDHKRQGVDSGVFGAYSFGHMDSSAALDVCLKSEKSLFPPDGAKIKRIFGVFSEDLWCDGIFREAQKLPILLGLFMAQSQGKGGFS